LSLLALEAEGDALLVGVHALEVGAVVLAQELRTDMARGVALGLRVLDLDDLGTEIGKEEGAIGSRAELLDGHDPDAFQRLHATGFLLLLCLAMMMRCFSLVPSPMQVSGASR